MLSNAIRSTALGRVGNRAVLRSIKSPVQFQKHLSTQKPSNSRSVARTTLIGLAIGLPVLYLAYGYSAPTKKQQTSVDVLNEALFDWKSRVAKPYTLEEAEAWLKAGEKVEHGPQGSGIKKWYTASRPSNAICEDNYVEARYQIPSNGEASSPQPWFFWGIFDGHAYVILVPFRASACTN